MKKLHFYPVIMAVGFIIIHFFSCKHETPGNICDLRLTANASAATSSGNDGIITATAQGGSGFMFSLDGGTPQSSGIFSNKAAGIYKIVVINDAGCKDSTTVTVSGPTNPNPGGPLTATATATQVSNNCTSDGTITVTASGGTSPYQYSKNGTNFQAGSTFSNLAVGAITITVKDAAGQTTTATASVSAPGTMSFTADIKPIINQTCGSSNVTCHTHRNNWTTYSDIVGTSSGTSWSGNLSTFLKRISGTSGSANSSCPLTTSSGAHDMPPSPSTAWTTFVKGPLTVWISQGYPNN